jgi:hypothetical protein
MSAFEIQVQSDVDGNDQRVKGSDNRMNVSGRVDGRPYYVARDDGLAFSIIWESTNIVTGEEFFYLKNTSPTHDIVISAIGVNSELLARVKLFRVTGTPSGGEVLTPTNTNGRSANVAVCTSQQAADDTGIAGLTEGVPIDYVGVTAGGHEEMRLQDTVRLGQDQAVAMEATAVASNCDFWGVCFIFFEPRQGA